MMDSERFDQAIRLRDAGRAEDALREFVELEEHTSDPEGKASMLGNQASCLAILGRHQEAMQKLILARRIAPKTQIHLYLDFQEAGLLQQTGEFEKALKILDDLQRYYKGVLTAPEHEDLNVRTQIFRGVSLVALRRYREARAALEGCLNFHLGAKDERHVLFNLGVCYNSLGERDLAKETLQGVLQKGLQGANAVSAHYFLGTIYFSEKAYAKALMELEWCLAHVEEGRIPKKHICDWLVSLGKTLGLKDNEYE